MVSRLAEREGIDCSNERRTLAAVIVGFLVSVPLAAVVSGAPLMLAVGVEGLAVCLLVSVFLAQGVYSCHALSRPYDADHEYEMGAHTTRLVREGAGEGEGEDEYDSDEDEGENEEGDADDESEEGERPPEIRA
jgi:hypothetical protein